MSHNLSAKLNSADLKAGTGISITETATIGCTLNVPISKCDGASVGSIAILEITIATNGTKSFTNNSSTVTSPKTAVTISVTESPVTVTVNKTSFGGTWRVFSTASIAISNSKYTATARFAVLGQRIA